MVGLIATKMNPGSRKYLAGIGLFDSLSIYLTYATSSKTAFS
jgi:hypothetical protein